MKASVVFRIGVNPVLTPELVLYVHSGAPVPVKICCSGLVAAKDINMPDAPGWMLEKLTHM